MRVEFLAEAEEELFAGQEWYRTRSEVAARAFATEVSWAIRQIAEFPTRYRCHVLGTRQFVLPNFPFSILYREQTGSVTVVAVAHHRRRPGYWRNR